jgi:hypothetical protein
MKDKLRNANSSQRIFGTPKKGHFHDFKQCIIEYARKNVIKVSRHRGKLNTSRCWNYHAKCKYW